MDKKKHAAHLLYQDTEQSAEKAGLHYVTDEQPGYTRQRAAGGSFHYFDTKGQRITDEKKLERLRKLVIPPAYENVWICPDPKGHLQFTGRDAKGRKQYRYHPEWAQARNKGKFNRMQAFGEWLPKIRETISKDLAARTFSRRKVTALALQIMDSSLIRVGNEEYAKSNKSYGLTTLRNKHAEISGSSIKLHFKGKKGVEQEVDINDRRLARIIKACKEIRGQHLFQYFDEAGGKHVLESGDLNEYLKETTEMDFTAKDFRTWGGSVLMLKCLQAKLEEEPRADPEKCVKEAVKEVAKGLGNTPSVCSKYYIHPQVAELFKSSKLPALISKAKAHHHKTPGLSESEAVLLQLLKEDKKGSN
jgi:DNA topoisomerase-1